MPARVIAIGLDGAEATLVERWSQDGTLKAFAGLGERGAVYRLSNSLETLPGAIWPELETGLSCAKVPLYYHPNQLHTGEAVRRPVEASEVDISAYYWSAASKAGLRVAAVDQPQSVLVPDFNGIQLIEWGCHDRNFATASNPPHLIDELRSRYSRYGVDSCDTHGCTPGGYRSLLKDLLEGADQKTAIMLDILGREDWDLFTCTYGESHCVGHQFWRFLDPNYSEYEDAGDDLRDAIRAVYQRIDNGIEALIDAAGPNATVVVYTSHGMGPYIGGYQLLPEVLARLGLSSDRGRFSTDEGANGFASKLLGRAQTYFSHLPDGIKALLGPIKDTGALKALRERFGRLPEPLESPHTKAVALNNNRCGAIRLNLKGREPSGCVAPGNEAASLLQEIRQEIEALRDPASGTPIVVRTVTATEAFGPEHHPDVPDLMVVFKTDMGRLEACESDRVGRIEVPLWHPNTPRSGDHTPESRLWISGPGIGKIGGGLEANVLDLAPSLLRLLDVPLPDGLDGRPLSVLDGLMPGPPAY